MAIATLSVDLVAQLGRLEQSFGKAERLAQRTTATIEREFSNLNKAVGGLVGALGVRELGQAFGALVNGVDRLNDLKEATGSTVENLSALEDIAARTGTPIETVTDALVKLNKTIGDAKVGSEAAEALKAIGLSASELRTLDPAEALLRVSQALVVFEDDGNKARIVQELFGKSIKEVAPLLNDLAAAGQLNATVTAEQAAQAEKFNKQIAELKKSILDTAREAVMPLLEAMISVGDAIKGTNDDARELSGTAAALAVPLQALTVLGANVAFVFKGIGTEIGAIAAQAAALGRGDFEGIRAIREAVVEDAKKAREALDAFEQRVLGGGRPAQGAAARSPRDLLRGIEAASATRQAAPAIGQGGKAPKAPGAAEFGPDVPPALAAAIKAIDEADETKAKALREELAELVRLVTQGVNVPDSAFAKLAEDLAKVDPAAKAAAEEMERVKREIEDAKRVFDETRTPSERLAAELDKLNKLLQAGRIDWDTYSRAVFDAQDAFDKALKPALEEVSEFAKEASRNIQDALGDSILASMEGNAKSIGDIWKNMLKRMVAEAAAAQLAETLLGKGYGSTTSKAGGYVGAALQWLGGFNWGGFSGGAGGSAGGSVGGSVGGGATLGKASMGEGGATQVVNVYGDVGPKALKAMRVVQAQSEARMTRRGAY